MNAKPRPNPPKEVRVVKSKILRELDKIAKPPLPKARTSCPIRRVGERSSLPEFGREVACKEFAPRDGVRPMAKGFRTQGCQTEREPSDYDGVVRYPSGRRVEPREKKEAGSQVEKMSPGGWGEGDGARRPVPVDHVKTNQSFPAIKPRLAPAKKSDPMRAPDTYQRGIIPKYLQKLKEVEEKHESKVRQVSMEKFRLMDADLVEKAEKLKRISSWHESYKRMVSELNTLSAAS